MFRSLRFRMAASHAAVLAVILVALGATGHALLARSLDRGATRELTAAAQEQVARMVEHGSALVPPDSDVPSRAAVRVAVFLPDGSLLGESGEAPPWLHPYPQQIIDIAVAGERVRVVTLRAARGGEAIGTVVAARSLLPEDRLMHRVRLLLLSGGGVAILASLAAGWWLAGRAVRPVERAYESQAGFAADASHELRTPLTFIRSAVEVLAETDAELGREVLGEIDYLTGLTQRLLLLARAERGTLTFDRVPIDLAELCRSAARRSEKAVGTQLTLQGGDARASGDRVAAEAALDAILENVHVHGGDEAVLRWRLNGDRAEVSVEDHGPGLPPELTRSAFQRFSRGDPSRARATGGSGLGLALARALIEAQGGSMSLEQTPGGGLTARIMLPAA